MVPLSRPIDHVVVIADTALLESLDELGDRAEQRLEAHAETAAELAANISAVDRADELAGGIHRKRGHIRVKPAPVRKSQ